MMFFDNDTRELGHQPNDRPDFPGRPDRPDKPWKPEHPERPDHPNHPERPLVILVNGADRELPRGTERLSYDEVVRLAYGQYEDKPNVIYTVVYSKGPVENKKGSLVKGESVSVREGMIFNVGRSDKS